MDFYRSKLELGKGQSVPKPLTPKDRHLESKDMRKRKQKKKKQRVRRSMSKSKRLAHVLQATFAGVCFHETACAVMADILYFNNNKSRLKVCQ